MAGLAACYDLLQTGPRVTILEAAKDFGGLASSFKLEGHPIERFYHFICRTDDHLFKFLDELGLEDKIHWRQTRTAFFINGRHYSFGAPQDLLRFSAIPMSQRIRFGLHLLRSRFRKQWKTLDRIAATPWLISNVGRQAYDVIWLPLLKIKFGDFHEQISAAWIWHRIWRVVKSRDSLLERESFGCLEYGTATLVDRLLSFIQAHPDAELRVESRVHPMEIRDESVTEIKAGNETFPCDAVISTVALPVLSRLTQGRTDPYFENVRRIETIGIVCMLLSLKRSFSVNFWTNISDPRISFNGVIEQTNLNQNLKAEGLNVIYIPFYLPISDPRYSASDDSLFAEYTSMLKLINPEFDETWIKEWRVFRAPYAQPIFGTGFADRMPANRSSIRGLYVTDSTQFYPEDRTISAAIGQGRKVAAMIHSDEPWP